MKRKKIFLGAYVNYLNAQNINCKSIAIHLDKSKEFKTPKNQRRKIFNLTLLKIIAKVLKVDYNYFICSFFASSPLAAQANR